MSGAPAFRTRVPGKWVLAGEHAVLRGGTAIALPHPTRALELAWRPSADRLRAEPAEAQRVIDEILAAIHERRADERRPFRAPRGILSISSDIPQGAGLGSSAALCVALTRWLTPALGLTAAQEFEFARALEHRFHGRSSGMDVAAVAAGEPVAFTMAGGPSPLGVRRVPRFTFHDTGVRCATRECVERVRGLIEADGTLGRQLDDRMAEAASGAREGLLDYDRGERERGLERLVSAMSRAQSCFEAWSLVPSPVAALIEDLRREGALAAKLTGSGGGGFVVALWD